jgi:hypothetical protein
MERKVLLVSRAVSRRLVKQGAKAVFLFGSRVRGDAYKESDVDIHAIGRRPQYQYRLERCQDFLVSVAWMTAGQHRQMFKNPSQVGGIIPAWRNAVIIYDPKGIASTIKNIANKWRWEQLNPETDRWVAEEITGWAEEVHRLVGNLELKRRNTAAINRSALAIKMTPILAVHNRILYDSESRLWDFVSKRMGRKWTQIQNAALGEGRQSFEDTCKAALQLYALVAQQVSHLLDRRQYLVVAHACDIAGYPLKN